MKHNCEDLITLFNKLFAEPEQTLLVGGGQEPVYLPATVKQTYHQIIFTQDYFSSALHEIAHWCIASKQRRLLVDYGYWYKSEDRNSEEQQLFEQMEVKPQALEWIFSEAVGIKFHVSADNLQGNNLASSRFKLNVYQQVMHYLISGLPPRAQQFKDNLLTAYQRAPVFNTALFFVEKL